MIEWRTEKRKVSSLKDWAKNPRKFTTKGMEDLRASMTRLGYIDPIAINQDGTIIGGHARKKMLKELGLKEIDVRVPDRQLTDKEIEEAVVRLNKNVAGEWDFDLLANNFETDDLIEWGFAAEELGITVEPTEGLTDPDDVPEPPQEPVSKLGDVWVLGNHRLMCGDSTSIDAVERLMDGQKADMVFTDPPYNVNYDGKGSAGESLKRAAMKAGGAAKKIRPIANDSMTDEQFHQFCRDFFASYIAASKPGASTYVCHSDRACLEFRNAFKDAGYHFSANIVWAKDRATLGRADYQSQHELILYGWPSNGSHAYYGDRKQTTVWNLARPTKSDLHPTMKPVELVQKAINNSSKSGDIVLDLFGGSGSTLIACEMTGRHARLMELSPAYCDVIVKRWEDFTGQKAARQEAEASFAA